MKIAQVCIQGWPALMSDETAARYLSLDMSALYEVAARASVGPVDVTRNVDRWRKTDLDALIKKLPNIGKPTPVSTERTITLDAKTVARIADALVELQSTAERRDPPSLISIKSACETLGLSRTTLYRMMTARQLQVCRIGSRTLIPDTEIEDCAVADTVPTDFLPVIAHFPTPCRVYYVDIPLEG